MSFVFFLFNFFFRLLCKKHEKGASVEFPKQRKPEKIHFVIFFIDIELTKSCSRIKPIVVLIYNL